MQLGDFTMTDEKTAPREGDSPKRQSTLKIRQLSIQKKIAFSLFTVLILFLGAELVCRVGGCLVYGFSPYYLFYGWEKWMADQNPGGHSFMGKGYFKFHPNQVVNEYGMFAKPTPIRINNMGFRGQDFDATKDKNTFRIICLGGSSTFGFFDRDDFTYPALLQERFDEDGRTQVEVINTGVPHAKLDNLVGMLRGELLGYDPDLITLYTGFNDASYYLDANVMQRTARWVHGHFATYVALKNVLDAVGGPTLHSKWRGFGKSASHEAITTQVRLHREKFHSNIMEILSLADQAGVQVVFILQPVDLIDRRKHRHGTHDKVVPYWDEVASIRQKYDEAQPLAHSEVSLLVHSGFMEILRTLSAEKQLILVDNIAIVDANPSYFASYVHLTEEANASLADALYERIEPTVNGSHGLQSTDVEQQ